MTTRLKLANINKIKIDKTSWGKTMIINLHRSLVKMFIDELFHMWHDQFWTIQMNMMRTLDTDNVKLWVLFVDWQNSIVRLLAVVAGTVRRLDHQVGALDIPSELLKHFI